VLADSFPPAGPLPWLSVDQMREVDRVTVEELGVSLLQMMENAGYSLAMLARALVDSEVRGRRVAVVAGTGGNGGGGLAAARHLAAAGARVAVTVAAPADELDAAARAQHDALVGFGVPVSTEPDFGGAELVLDALLGYGQTGPPRGRAAELLRLLAGSRVLSLDVPSGLELASGRLHEPAVHAEATLTLALPKEGLRSPGVAEAVGALYLADISVPPSAYERAGIAYASPFGSSPIVRVAEGRPR
jgi:NAD(P)H-hydrate epimerase